MHKIQIPQPELITRYGLYAFSCEHKELRIEVLSDTRKGIQQEFIDQLRFEIEGRCEWLPFKITEIDGCFYKIDSNA